MSSPKHLNCPACGTPERGISRIATRGQKNELKGPSHAVPNTKSQGRKQIESKIADLRRSPAYFDRNRPEHREVGRAGADLLLPAVGGRVMPKLVNASVAVTKDVTLTLTLARLKRYVVASGLLRDMRRHDEFLPRGAGRRMKSIRARTRARKAEKRAAASRAALRLSKGRR
jgi:hypothetical protein